MLALGAAFAQTQPHSEEVAKKIKEVQTAEPDDNWEDYFDWDNEVEQITTKNQKECGTKE